MTQSWYDSRAATLLEISNTLPLGFASNFLNDFITGNGVPEASYGNFRLTSTYDGLSHPLGAKWSADNDASATLRAFNPGTEVSDAVLNSVAVETLAKHVVEHNKAEIVTYFVQHSNEGAHTFTYDFLPEEAKNVKFNESDGFSALFFAFGRVAIHGSVTVSCQPLGEIASSHRFLVTSAELSGNFADLYDFNYFTRPYNYAGIDLELPLWAASVEAGYATLSTNQRPSGRVSKNQVNFSGVRQWNQIFEGN